jgi:hypothetical protein
MPFGIIFQKNLLPLRRIRMIFQNTTVAMDISVTL